ncbi:unnamed protein product, partial [Brenthis ino]
MDIAKQEKIKMDQYQEVKTNEEDVNDGKPTTKSIFKQVLICSSVWIQFVMAGLCVGAPTVIVPQINREANSTIIDSDLTSWIFATLTISNTPWVIILPFFTERFGRKIPQIITTFVSIVVFLCYYASSNAYHIIIVEVIQGYMHTSNLTVAIIIITEYTSPRLRGTFLTVTGAAFFWGIWIANAIGTFFHWRNITIVGFICSFYTLTVFTWPESPYWLASKGRFDECRKSFRWIHGYTSEKELREIISTKREEMERKKTEVKMSFCSTIRTPEFYKPMVLAIVAVLQYQFSGKMICSLFILDIFKTITTSESTAYMAMLILNGVTVIRLDGSFLLYGITCGLCTLYLFIYLPETKDKTQCEIEAFFIDKKEKDNMPTLLYR